ncbi:MAG: NAD(P)-dependent oxidoreductase [Nanoarchaeota archaeon]|nr:NAD(P)-dependent oxidoreductase [Nanoarchaeota archaeon]
MKNASNKMKNISNKMKGVLITGATGFVGKCLIKKLPKNLKVRCLIEKGTHLKESKENIEIIKGDLSDISSLERATKDISIVIHLAAVISSRDKTQFRKVNIKGTENLINACVKNKIRKFIYMSSCDIILKKKDYYAYSKIKAEEIVKSSGMNYTILRPTVIYGKGDRGNMNLLFKIIKKCPLIPIAGKGTNKLQPVYVEDVVESIIKCLNLKKKNQVYFIAGSKELTYNELIDKISGVLSRKTIKIHLPFFMIKVLLKPYEVFSKNPSVSYKKLSVREDKTCDISKARKDLNFKPISFEQGLKKTLNNN